MTTRAFGTLSTASDEPVSVVMGRWQQLRETLLRARRFATAYQVHGTTVLTHHPGWSGWLRGDAADGHLSPARGTGLAVTVADCVPVLMAHPSGAVAAVHAGWRGTAAGILGAALSAMGDVGCDIHDVHIHLGPAICGRCYEVSPDVYGQLTGLAVDRPTPVDLRALLADQALAAGVPARGITTSAHCTRCDNDRFFSHRAGDPGRQVGAIIADA
ncbi:MAG TPA: polyphenol oxidase family protein [Gemmatimonadaceae bacterium]|nr:polyphenol oxidase family protein [Gemmatimonadaceae bacterium]